MSEVPAIVNVRACAAIALSILVLSFSAPVVAQGVCPAGNVRVAPTSRYVLLSPGPVGETVVVDVATSLVWKPCPQGLSDAACATGSVATFDWSGALGAAEVEDYAGFDDWRLPNRNELRSLVERGCWSPAINTTVFPASANASVWSSTTRVTLPTHAWAVGFGDGGVEIIPKSFPLAVRLVRGGERLEGFDSELDFNPSPFGFAPQTEMPSNSPIASELITVAGVDGSVSIGVRGASSSQYRINAGDFTSLPGLVRNADLVQVRHLSANGASEATTTTLQIGDVSADFVSTTAGEMIFADGFEFGVP